MPDRPLTLRFPARCHVCTTQLAAGASARWDPETRVVACPRCAQSEADGPDRRDGPDRSGSLPVADRRTLADPSAVDPRWHQLVDYHLRAVRRAAVTTPPAVHDRDGWAVVDLEREDLVTGRGDVLAVTPGMRRLFDAAAPGDAVFYGWPLVVVTDATGSPRVAPLLVTELEPPTADGASVTVPRDDAPYLNPALLTEAFFPLEAVAAAQDSVAGGLAFGDAEATTAGAARVLDALGLGGAHLDPDALVDGRVGRPGVYNTAVVVRGASSLATRALVRELTELRDRDDWHTTAARWLLVPPSPTTGDRAADRQPVSSFASDDPLGLVAALPPVTVEGLDLNDAQEQALERVRARDVTVVTGPPGTGKSQLVAAVVVNQWLLRQSVLVASTNNPAVDVAVRRCAAIDEALLVRTGNRAVRESLPARLEALAGRARTSGPSGPVISRQLEVGAARRAEVLERLGARTRAEAELAQLVVDLEALRPLLWGTAPTPVRPPDPQLARRRATRVSRTRWFPASRTRRLLAWAGVTEPGARPGDVAAWGAAQSRAQQLVTELGSTPPSDGGQDRRELDDSAAAWARAGRAALRDVVQQQLHDGAASLRQLARTRTGSAGARAVAVARTLPWTPGWACTALSAAASFPLDAGLFDLLVVDEASQCAVAQVLPLAYRARRIMVVGDPNQLSPVTTLGRAALDGLARAVQSTPEALRASCVSAGDDSAFSAYAARCRGQVLLLDEHYRCHPGIARFVNEQFYDGRLRVLTPVTSGDGLRGLSLVDVPGETAEGELGGVVNHDEARAVVAWVLAHRDEPGTLGVVTPFSAQASLIRRLLGSALGDAEGEPGGIRVGTAHAFQGDERDVMVFSTVLARGARPGTVHWVEAQRNLVNVAVSRARRALVVVGDTDSLSALPLPTLHALVELASGDRGVGPEDVAAELPTLHSEAERRLYLALAHRGPPVRLKPVVEGYELDFAVETAHGPVDLEVDGIYHLDVRGRQRRQDLARDRVLEGLGWRVLRVPAWRALQEPDRAAEWVCAQLATGVPGPPRE